MRLYACTCERQCVVCTSLWVETHVIKASYFWQLPYDPLPRECVGVGRVSRGGVGPRMDGQVPEVRGQGCCHPALVEVGRGLEKGWGW